MKAGVPSKCLHEIWFDRIFEEQRQCSCNMEFLRMDGTAIARISYDDLPQSFLHILKIRNQTENRHHFSFTVMSSKPVSRGTP